ncbi:MAG: EAL domain-containing protein, partial [Nitrospinae bacterium]|nr:EAL domain-containing protein [Nitrospinota bacterium]
GDEFVILLTGLTDDNYSTRLAERILDAVKPAFKIDKHEIQSSFSIGIALYPKDGRDIETLFKNADSAMYRAKKQGKNSYFVHDPQILSEAQSRLNLKSLLDKALDNENFVLNYQAKADIKTGEIQRLQVLLRMDDPERGLVLPEEFMPIAEESGLIVPIGDWVLQSVCRQIKSWKEEGVPVLPVSINLCREQLLQEKLTHKVESCLKSFNLPPEMFEFEFPESALLETSEYKNLMELHEFGAKLALDNFGVGTSSLKNLSRVPLCALNIDAELIQGFSDKINSSIINASIAIGKSLKIKTVAKGVETSAQKEWVAQSGCDWAQGYLIGNPEFAEKLKPILKE